MWRWTRDLESRGGDGSLAASCQKSMTEDLSWIMKWKEVRQKCNLLHRNRFFIRQCSTVFRNSYNTILLLPSSPKSRSYGSHFHDQLYQTSLCFSSQSKRPTEFIKLCCRKKTSSILKFLSLLVWLSFHSSFGIKRVPSIVTHFAGTTLLKCNNPQMKLPAEVF